MQEAREDRSLGELFGDLAREMGALVRQEVELARVEMTRKATQAGKDVASLVLGGAVLYAGFLAIMAAIILALAEAGLPRWLAALLVGLAVGAVGYVLVHRAQASLKQADIAPRQTIETLKEDKEWAKEHVT